LQVFLSQLHRRARLVNRGFQKCVAAIVASHGIFSSSEPWTLTHDYDQSETPADHTCSNESEVASRKIQCIFSAGEVGIVEIETAPVKTLARMREKLAE
jgi:hypothetical protein